MTSVEPPTYYFDGIEFNTAFYTTSSSGGLTLAQANGLYLKKNTADTATALETFTGGIATNDIQSTTTSTALSIGSSQTDGILNLGTGTTRTATGVINIGNSTGLGPIRIETGSTKNTDTDPAIRIGTAVVAGGRTIKIGNTSTTNADLNNIHIGNIRVRNNFIDNVTSNTGAIYIGAAQTTGAIFIGSGDGTTRSGGVSMCSAPSCSSNIDFFTNTTCTGTFNVGTATTTTNTTKANILTGNTTGTLTLGNTSNTVQVNGSLSIGTGKNITLAPSTSYVSPIALTMLGGRSVGTVSTSLSSISNVVSSIRLTSAGIYIINWSYRISYSTRPTYFFSSVATTTTAISTGPLTYGNSYYGSSDMGLFESLNRTTTSGSQVVVATLDNYYNLVIFLSGGSGVAGVGGFYNIVRIA